MTGFKRIDHIANYILQGLAQQNLSVFLCAKTSAVTAEPGTVGQSVRTVMQNGLEETVNTVGTDCATGQPDWIVRNPSGECYVVKDSVFREKYVPDSEMQGRFLSTGKAVMGIRIRENIRFTAPWGEEMRIVTGGVLIVNSATDIYGIQPEEFLQTYTVLPQCPEDLAQQTIVLLQLK